MSVHETLKAALADAVAAADQPPAVAKRLAAWLDALSDGETNLVVDREETQKRFESVLNALKVDEVES